MFSGPGANSCAAASDPAMAACWDQIMRWEYGDLAMDAYGGWEYRGNRGLEVRVYEWFWLNSQDCVEWHAARPAARLLLLALESRVLSRRV